MIAKVGASSARRSRVGRAPVARRSPAGPFHEPSGRFLKGSKLRSIFGSIFGSDPDPSGALLVAHFGLYGRLVPSQALFKKTSQAAARRCFWLFWIPNICPKCALDGVHSGPRFRLAFGIDFGPHFGTHFGMSGEPGRAMGGPCADHVSNRFETKWVSVVALVPSDFSPASWSHLGAIVADLDAILR